MHATRDTKQLIPVHFLLQQRMAQFLWVAALLFIGITSLYAEDLKPGGFCDGVRNNSRSQVCMSGSCDLNCTKTSSPPSHSQCDQLCLWFPCPELQCSSLNCLQRCVIGHCNKLICASSQDCLQSCHTNCSKMLCDSRKCTQECEKGHCNLESSGGDVSKQTSGEGSVNMLCSAKECTQTCAGERCGLVCRDAADKCTQSCKGPCQMDCDAKNCETSCTGGKCNVNCGNRESEMCEQSCAHGACNLTCTAKNCDSTCAAGNCSMSCAGDKCTQECGHDCGDMTCAAKQCSQTCTKGRCAMKCMKGAEMCEMSCPGGNCKMLCDGDKCKRSCSGGGCESSGSGEEVPTVPPATKPSTKATGSRVVPALHLGLTAGLTTILVHL